MSDTSLRVIACCSKVCVMAIPSCPAFVEWRLSIWPPLLLRMLQTPELDLSFFTAETGE